MTTAYDRLTSGFYNSLVYNAVTNPGGFRGGGHVLNLPAAMADVATVASAINATEALLTGGAVGKAGDTMTGRLTGVTAAAGAAGYAPFRAPPGVDPTTNLANGDIWTTTAEGLKVRTNGVTRTMADLNSTQTFSNKTFTAPVLGAATGTTLALNGASLSGHHLAVAGDLMLSRTVAGAGERLINFYNGATNSIQIDFVTGNTADGQIVFYTKSQSGSLAETARFGADGAVSFRQAGTTAAAANGYVDGSNGLLLRSTSSRRYKTDEEALDPAYAERVLELEPIWYRSLADSDNPAWSFYGLAAEDVAAIEPRLVHWTRDVIGYEDEPYTTIEQATVEVEVRKIVEREGRQVLTTVMEPRPVFDEENLYTEDGLLIVEPGDDGEPRPVTVRVPRMVEVTKTRKVPIYGELRPDGVQYERLAVLQQVIIKRLAGDVAELTAWKNGQT